MAGISRYEKAVLGMTAAFLLFTGGWFLVRQNACVPYEVTVDRSGGETSDQPVQPERSCPDSLLEGETINVNTADVYDLQRLPGVGEKRAQAIVKYREEHGLFQSVEELTQVPGIGEGILSQLQKYAAVR